MDKALLKQYLLRGGAWAFAGKMLTALMGLALSALLARLLSPEDMGAYFLAFNLATFFSISARMGLENTLLRFVSEAIGRNQPGRVRAVIQKGLILALIGAAVVSATVYAGAGPWLAERLFHSRALGAVVGFIAIWLVLLTFQFLFAEIFRAFQDIRAAVLFGGLITATVTVVFLSIYKLAMGQAMLGQVLSWVLVAGATNMVLAVRMLTRKLHSLEPPTEGNVTYLEIAGHSWPLLLNALTLFVMGQSDLWILAAFRPDEEVAIYGAAARLVWLVSVSQAIIEAIINPLIARINIEGNLDKLEDLLRKSATLASIPSSVVIVAFVFLGKESLGFIYGPFYMQGATVLLLLGAAQWINTLSGSCRNLLIQTGHGLILLKISLILTVFEVSLSLYLVQPLGKEGVAIAVMLSIVMQQMVMVFYSKRYCRVLTIAGYRQFLCIVNTAYDFLYALIRNRKDTITR